MKHLQIFNSHSEFEAAEMETPWVAFDGEHVHYPSVEESNMINGYEYVDLGLPSGLKWASCNVGANSQEESGLYFQWGDIIGYDGKDGDASPAAEHSTWETCPFNNGASIYNLSYFMQNINEFCPNNTLAILYDAAHVHMGGSWRMPTADEINELISNTTYEWIQINGINGGKFTASNGNYIFIPASGYFYDNHLDSKSYNGHCWSSSLCNNFGSNCAYDLSLDSEEGWSSDWIRIDSYPVRAVSE